MDRSRRSFPTPPGWFFARPAVAHECRVAALSCPGRSAARNRALQTRDHYGLWRSQISGAALNFVTRCTASGTRDSVGRVRSLIHFSNSPSRSRGRFCVRGLQPCFTHPESRGGRSAEKRSGACDAPVGHAITRHARRLTRRLASHDAGRSPLGAPPWRFWASGPRFRLRHPPSLTLRRAWIRAASSSQPGRSAWRAASRASRSLRLRSHPPQDATPPSAFRIVSRRRPSMSEAGKLSSTTTSRSQEP
jgi:hypothetical protein